MKEIIPKDSRYIPFVQQKSCCAVTCFLMIMHKRGIPLISQELLGYHLGLAVSPESKNLFWNARSGKKPKSGYGTQVFEKAYDPNKVFKKLKIPLKFKAYHVDDYETEKDLQNFMTEAVRNDREILVCFDHGTLNGNDKHAGHVCILDRIYPKKKLVRIIDPSPDQPKWRMVKISKLRKAMKLHPANGGGFWEL